MVSVFISCLGSSFMELPWDAEMSSYFQSLPGTLQLSPMAGNRQQIRDDFMNEVIEVGTWRIKDVLGLWGDWSQTSRA